MTSLPTLPYQLTEGSRQGGRPYNEDRLGHTRTAHALLAVVADGMGGHNCGEVAAQITVDTLGERLRSEAAQAPLGDPFLFLQQSLELAHHRIGAYAESHELSDSPRTTAVALLIQDNTAYWAHVGDSRLYLVRNGRVHTRTRDHSHVRLLVDRGQLSEAQAALHRDRNKVYTCLGGPQTPEIEFSRITPLQGGDTLLLCTDGVWGALPAETLEQLLARYDDQLAVRLLDAAEIAGGPHGDNLSLILCHCVGNAGNSTELNELARTLAALRARPPLKS